ncbi:MAG: hypothetical protein DHS20C17_00500 [Cyclobacteriaceae bacterium]|nr:MAG: hypothetical protein DHS20C17_00500 [Cyclobacteriaceae bacterium]
MLDNWLPDLVLGKMFLGMVLFLSVITLIVHVLLLRVSYGQAQKFTRVYMLATLGKLFVYLVFILSVAFYYRSKAPELLIAFLICYISYTALEVIFLRKHLDAQRS